MSQTRGRFVHTHSHEEILEKYGDRMVMCGRMPEIFAKAMGDQMYTPSLYFTNGGIHDEHIDHNQLPVYCHSRTE